MAGDLGGGEAFGSSFSRVLQPMTVAYRAWVKTDGTSRESRGILFYGGSPHDANETPRTVCGTPRAPGIRRRFGNVRASLVAEKIFDNFILQIHFRIWQTENFKYERLL